MTTATVVGSGPNGLAAAIRLAQAGIRVTVIEAAPVPGGGARTSELTLPGVLHDDCSTAMPGAVASPFFRSLHLERHGLRWLHHDVVVAHPTDDATGVVYRDLARTAMSMGADGALWRRLFAPLTRNADAVFDTAFAPVVSFPRHPRALLQLGLRAAPPASWWARAFRRPENAAAFAGIAAHMIGSLTAPLSSSVGAMLTTALHAHGWPFPRGGAGALTSALLAEFAELGGRIELGRRVTRVDELDTDVVVLTVPPRTALTMMDVPAGVRHAWRRFRPGPGAFKLDLAIEGDVPWRDDALRRAGVVHLGGTFAQVARAEADVVRGRMPGHPFVLVTQPHLVDPSRSHNGINPLWLYAHVPNGWPRDETERLLAELERYAPGARERILAVHTRGPGALEAHNTAYLGGDIGGGATTLRQLIARPRMGPRGFATGVRGVYLGGASTAPAGGVHGMCGVNAAELALRDLTR
ncbi:phytoene desaturase family protein [Microbacterium nymphoidis]|uniref:phytoene desaturase family protein n=1 Tax=Microbacterium nymphoidis TaxID=2898586 RepID=UPI001E3A6E0B|nr:NAD(P)/FAD-dependent oxidoreductase [Microbacterium nymphoidis]MCD2499300.1 NAD(P)/FAD-dependent oxidoreductase [Microbacterium nymphoidis]